MLTKEITYRDFDNNPQKMTAHFNLAKHEIMELLASYDGDPIEIIQTMIAKNDRIGILNEFKKFIKMSYGVRNGDRFVKSPEITEAFMQTMAFDTFFMEIATDENAGSAFIAGIIPADMLAEAQKVQEETLPFPPPSFRV